jgi:hypothetical protein
MKRRRVDIQYEDSMDRENRSILHLADLDLESLDRSRLEGSLQFILYLIALYVPAHVPAHYRKTIT